MEEPTKPLEVGAKLPVEAKCSHHKFHFGRTSQNACGRVEKKMLLSRLGMGFLRSTGISNFFPGVEKKK